ncbi:anaerobic ribonucleoside-triphosphate reductase activating protein [Prevotella histicola]|uniref:Anaerobic ribonucleoside-triphosphate reductase activating protein n=1 Tax=Prevotella histicola F0411 TaxID=857291 RepID=G6AFY4_9BACT|nr:anaerobic ribonucleoside-triphosphate reductase activating protein [Prevotella histicola]EHG16436.1 anaerobic ribonucleoside-triphosphate reductase activating protein [Prevotella histicola F0411]QUB85032.1 anaerobic ribonucleoside-triphosphate reductase activating protein [Prevotella histicola]
MLHYINTDIVFQEFPDEVTLAINISGCPCRCPGCHSSFLWKDEGNDLTTETLDKLISEAGNPITCVGFMGGDIAPERVDELAEHIRKQHPRLKIGWYTGRTAVSPHIHQERFDYIKIGPYLKHLGALNSPRTNQRMLRRCTDGTFEDITSRFWRK